MQGRLAELTEKRGAREEEAAKRVRDTDERLKTAQAALQTAHRERQVSKNKLLHLVPNGFAFGSNESTQRQLPLGTPPAAVARLEFMAERRV